MEAGQTPPGAGPSPGGAPAPGGDAPQSEEELRARLEEEMRKVRVQDLVLQSVASIVNLTARRIAKEDERDLEQAKAGIDAVRALVDQLDPEPQQQVKQALSELQMLFARASGEGPPAGDAGEPPETESPQPEQPKSGEPPSRLWTPPGT